MAGGYPIPDLAPGQFHRTELVVRRSRFITSVGHAPGVEAAKSIIAKVCEEFPDASHNCFAYNASEPGATAFAG
ncbi:MAG: YigZ family protein, partial [Succinivibrionaceae bacterium]|nr:YigZ family protein [Succinivibrionaceae bacterium]